MYEKMDLEAICKKYSDALGDPDASKATEVRRVLRGTRIDFTLLFKSAQTDPEDVNALAVTVFKPATAKTSTKHVLFSVPKTGNEKLTELDEGRRIRVKGAIRSIGLDAVFLEPDAEYEVQ